MIRHAETGHASTTDAASGDQKVLKVEVGEAVITGRVYGTSVDVLIVGVGNPEVVAGRGRTALVVRSGSTESVGARSRHDSVGWFGW